MSRRFVTTVALVLSAASLAACGTGRNPTTYQDEQGRRAFAGSSVGSVDLRNLGVDAPITGTTYAAGDSVTISGSLVNPGSTADALIQASSSYATSAELLVAGDPVTSIPVPANGTADPTWVILLQHLTKPIASGDYIDLTLSFSQGGTTKPLAIPVRIGDTGADTRTPDQDPYKSAE